MSKVALFGNVAIEMARCPDCKAQAFVIDRKLACCDRRIDSTPDGVKRVTSPEDRRREPSKAEKAVILAQQEDRCLYCERSFGLIVVRGRTCRRLRVTWDHLVPFVYSQDNSANNFAASCQICNSIKSSKLFPSIDAARVYVQMRWTEKGWT